MTEIYVVIGFEFNTPYACFVGAHTTREGAERWINQATKKEYDGYSIRRCVLEPSGEFVWQQSPALTKTRELIRQLNDTSWIPEVQQEIDEVTKE